MYRPLFIECLESPNTLFSCLTSITAARDLLNYSLLDQLHLVARVVKGWTLNKYQLAIAVQSGLGCDSFIFVASTGMR